MESEEMQLQAEMLLFLNWGVLIASPFCSVPVIMVVSPD